MEETVGGIGDDEVANVTKVDRLLEFFEKEVGGENEETGEERDGGGDDVGSAEGLVLAGGGAVFGRGVGLYH